VPTAPLMRGGAAVAPLGNGDSAGIAGGGAWVHPRIWIRPSKRVGDRGKRRLRTMFCRILSLNSATRPSRCDGPDRRADATQSLVIGRRKCVKNVELTQENVPRRCTFKHLLAVGPLVVEQRHQTAQGWPIHRTCWDHLAPGSGGCRRSSRKSVAVPHFAPMLRRGRKRTCPIYGPTLLR
jgi:hypothetical protein